MVDSDKHWIRLGQIDPYLQTVTTLDPYKLDPGLPREGDMYFASGERYVADLFETIERHVLPRFKPRISVDFGCSVGRIAIPLARRSGSVIGLDVSTNALAEAGLNADRFGATNARWLQSDDQLTQIDDRVDFFHSYNVLQHLVVNRGLGIVRRAVARLTRGGVIAIHVPYADRASHVRHAINWAQAHVPGVHMLANVTRGRPYDYPQMLMNPYDLGALFSLLREQGCGDAYCKFIDQGRYPGVIVIARTLTDPSGTTASSE